jgi:hypothetical protein
MPSGFPGPKRPSGDRPICGRCPKILHKDVLSDEKALRVVLYYRFGLGESDDMIRKDSWMYAALRIVKARDQMLQEAELNRKISRERFGRR